MFADHLSKNQRLQKFKQWNTFTTIDISFKISSFFFFSMFSDPICFTWGSKPKSWSKEKTLSSSVVFVKHIKYAIQGLAVSSPCPLEVVPLIQDMKNLIWSFDFSCLSSASLFSGKSCISRLSSYGNARHDIQ